MTEHPRFAYKLLAPDDAAVFDRLSHTQTELDQTDGYVHLSTKAQLGETFDRYYEHQPWCLLLEVDLLTRTDVRWEASRGGDLFPHLYGQLRKEDVQRRWLLKRDENGAAVLPDDLQ